MCTWNAIDIKTRTDELIEFLTKHDVDIMCINETRLKPTDRFKVPGYIIHRQDRLDGRNAAGGVATLIKSHIYHTRLNTLHNTNTIFEHIIIKLTDNTHIITLYNRPSNHFSVTDLQAFNIFNKFVLIGDLNAKHPDWNRGRGNVNGSTLYRYAQQYNANIVYPDKPTHFPLNNTTPSCVDLAVYRNVRDVSEAVSPSELPSDHDPVLLTLSGMRISTRPPIHATITSYKHTDWHKYRQTLDTLTQIHADIDTVEQLELAVERFTHTLTQAKQAHTYTRQINTTRDELPADILDTIRERNQVRRIWQRSHAPAHKQHMDTLTALIKRKIHAHKNTKWNTRLASFDPGDVSFWTLSKLLRKPKTRMPNLEHNNSTQMTDADKAEAIAETFERVHEIDPHHTAEHLDIIQHANTILNTPHRIHKHELRDYLATPAEVAGIIKRMPRRKAPGSDGIDPILIKNLSKKAVVQLTYIINGILKLQHWPAQWKEAIIVPVPKPGKDHSQPASYRPISLLSHISKVAERVILSRLVEHDNTHNITSDVQFGFRTQHNTTQQLSRVVTDIIVGFNQKNVTVMTLLDAKNAFDKVWHLGLVYKLHKYHFPIHLIKLIHSYLSTRTFRVRVGGALSAPRGVPAGVPQGSCLGPRLYTLYINDMPTFTRTNTALYADDTAIYAKSFSAIVANKQTQIHINMLERYWDRWKLPINANKTETITFTRKYTNTKIFQPLKVYEHAIHPPKHTVKYLGVHLDRTLKFLPHIKTTLTKANARLRLIYPMMCRQSALSAYNKRLLYSCVLRPTLTYAAPVWFRVTSHTAKVPLQRFQNKCLRLITSSDRYARIARLHRITGIPYLNDHLAHLTRKFYDATRLHTDNPLITHITHAHHGQVRDVHRLPYETDLT